VLSFEAGEHNDETNVILSLLCFTLFIFHVYIH
jgi:hypothetical protein